MGVNKFTKEQLEYILGNFRKVHSKLETVFMAIADNPGIKMVDINIETGTSDFIRDKCIAALQLPGLIEYEGQGTAKICNITEDGKVMKELILNKRGK